MAVKSARAIILEGPDGSHCKHSAIAIDGACQHASGSSGGTAITPTATFKPDAKSETARKSAQRTCGET
jgi:hypothetical protein